jgi:nicotinamidase-related amidase
MKPTPIRRNELGILLIDAQPAFWEIMAGPQETVLVRMEHLLMLAGILKLPLIATFEHPVESKGWLPQQLDDVFPAHGQRHVKRTFDCCSKPAIRQAIDGLGVRQLAVAGAETDVCILQSVLALLALGYQVFLLEDCLFTSEPHPRPALQRMYQASAIPCTFKTLFYELAEQVGTFQRWMDEGGLPESARKRFLPPEDLPPWTPT